jgi:hypothetical protein
MKRHLHLLGFILLFATGAPLSSESADTPRPAVGQSAACDRVRFECKTADKNDFLGAKVEGSNVSRTGGFVTLAEIKDAPDGSGWGEVRFENPRSIFRRRKRRRWTFASSPAPTAAMSGEPTAGHPRRS